MSLILDALKKADSERHAAVDRSVAYPPAIGAAQPWPTSSSSHRDGRHLKWAICIALVVISAGWIIWQLRPTTALPAHQTDVRDDNLTAHVVAPPDTKHAPVATAVVTATQLPVPAPIVVAALPTKVQPMTQLISRGQLPPQVQSEIPPFAVSGSIYSTNPKERLLLVDKRMLKEGDEIAPGLVLEHILQKGAVLRYKGYEFKVTD